jgi:putative membrane protein
LPGRASPALFVVLIAALLATLILTLGPVLHIDNSLDAIFTLVAGFVFVVAHGMAALGWRNIIAFVVITFVVSFASEATGVATGLIFGPYHYTDLLGPKILGVPPMIQVGYLSVGYASMVMGRIILSRLEPLEGWAILAATLAGSCIMVSWDVAMDPYQSTVSGDWIWHQGGPYFGIPLHNYAGWFGTVFAFMLVYFIFASRFEERTRRDLIGTGTLFWSMPVIFYAIMAFGIVVIPVIGGVSLPYASPGNYSGTLDQLEGSMSLVATFVMGSPVVFAICRLLGDRSRASA